MTAAELRLLIDPLLTLVRTAGDAIMEIYGRDDFDVQVKADRSPLTEADLAANDILVSGLVGLIPEAPVLSEESKLVEWDERRNWQRFWLVDPLDGTKEFVKRNDEFTVNVALIDGCHPILGVVHAPAIDETYWGGPDLGAFCARGGGAPQPQHVAADPTSGQPMQVVASRSHRSAELEEYLSGLGSHECIPMGSSLKLCLVAAGRAHHYPRIGPTMEWDTGAAHAVVLGAGGSVVDRQGQELRYNKADLLNPHFLVRNHP